MGWVFVFRACVSGTVLLFSLLSLCGPVRAQSLDMAKALDEQALERYRAGNFRQAGDLAEQALTLREKILGNDHPDVGLNLAGLATLRMFEGRLADAESHLSRAVGIMEKNFGNDGPAFGAMLNKLGELYIREGRYSDAEATLKRALAILQNAPDAENFIAATLNNLAALYEKQERVAEALPLMEQATILRERLLGPEDPEVATSSDNLGVLYLERGDYERAEALLKRALAIREKALGPEHPDVARSLNNLATLYSRLRRLEEGEAVTKHALSILEKNLPPGHPDFATVLNNLAGLYEAESRFREADAIYGEVLAMREKALPAGHPEIAQSVGILSTLAFERQDWRRALEYVRRASHMWIALSAKSRTIENRGIERDSNLFQFHVLVAYRVGANDASLLDETFEMAQWAEQTAAGRSLAAMSARQARGNGPLAQLVRVIQDFEKWRDGTESAVIAAQGRGDKDQAIERQAAIADMESRARSLYLELDEKFPEYGRLIGAEPVSVAETQKLLHDDEVLLQFLSASTSLRHGGVVAESFAWLVSKRDARWVRLTLALREISDAVAALRCGLDATLWDDVESAKKCKDLVGTAPRSETVTISGKDESTKVLPFDLTRAHELYNALLTPFADMIKRKHLIVVPSGPLTSLPFNVLVAEPPTTSAIPETLAQYRDVPWLGTRTAITVLPSVASLKALRQFAKASHASKPYLGIGNPLLDGAQDDPVWGADNKKRAELARAKRCSQMSSMQATAARGPWVVRSFASMFRGNQADIEDVRSWAPLPETADELCEVARRLGVSDSEILLGADAIERRLKDLSEQDRLADYAIVHFATRGALSGQVEGSAEPGLILTPPPKGTSDPQALWRDDGFLTASEIATLKLDADWVILSACNTAAAQGVGAEALSGIARAFFYAGGPRSSGVPLGSGLGRCRKAHHPGVSRVGSASRDRSSRGHAYLHARVDRKGQSRRGTPQPVGPVCGYWRGWASNGCNSQGYVG
jgi:CHAT domain-containing protein/tetratricopeptide (TPR) repeat protein